MARSLAILALALIATAAMAQHRRDPPLPVPPAPPPPPASSASTWQDAPVPDLDINPPANRSAQAEVAPGLLEAPDHWRGDTFRPDTIPSGNENRLFAPAPGVMLRVPVR